MVVKFLEFSLQLVKPLSIIVGPQLVAGTPPRSVGHLTSDLFQSLAEVFQCQLEFIIGEGTDPRSSVLRTVRAAIGGLGGLEREGLKG